MSALGVYRRLSSLMSFEHTSMTMSDLYDLGYAFWYLVPGYETAYVWAGTYQLPGIGPDIETECGYEPSDLILLHGPQPA